MPDYMKHVAHVSEKPLPERGAAVDLPEPPVTTEDPITDGRIAFIELLQKSREGDFLRALAEAVLPDLDGCRRRRLIGARQHEGSADRSLETRLGTLSLASPSISTAA
jgi:hypothetical protein